MTIQDLPGPQPQIDEMQRLLQRAERFASVVRQELEELGSSRDALIEAVEREEEERRREAMAMAESILGEAEHRGREIEEEATSRAAEIRTAARAEHRRLTTINAQYRATLSETLQALGDLPEIPPEITAQRLPEEHSTVDAADRFRPVPRLGDDG